MKSVGIIIKGTNTTSVQNEDGMNINVRFHSCQTKQTLLQPETSEPQNIRTSPEVREVLVETFKDGVHE